MNVVAFTILFFCLYNLFNLFFKKPKQNTLSIIFWSIVWGLPIIFILNPNLLMFLGDYLKIGRPVDIIIYLAIPFLFYLFFILAKKVEEIDNKFTELVRNLAIERAENEYKKKK